MAQYPEHEKMAAIHTESQAIGEFLEWLSGDRGLAICQNGIMDERPVYWIDALDEYDGDQQAVRKAALEAGVITARDVSWWHDIQPKLRGEVHHWEPYEREGYYPASIGIQKLLAEYFNIDLNKIEQEKRQMLDEIRQAHHKEEVHANG